MYWHYCRVTDLYVRRSSIQALSSIVKIESHSTALSTGSPPPSDHYSLASNIRSNSKAHHTIFKSPHSSIEIPHSYALFSSSPPSGSICMTCKGSSQAYSCSPSNLNSSPISWTLTESCSESCCYVWISCLRKLIYAGKFNFIILNSMRSLTTFIKLTGSILSLNGSSTPLL